MGRILLTLFFILHAVTLSSHGAELTPADIAKWETAVSGQHSMRALGEQFYVDMPMRRISNVKLGFFNERRARALGLKVPRDPRELEALMTRLFGIEIGGPDSSPIRMMATKYQDSSVKGAGSAMGDGRAVWTGELKLPTAGGGEISVDFVAKGIGQTPLAWTNNDPSHSDGKLKIRELVRSAIMSRANIENQLDSTDDLLGLVVYEEGQPPRGISIRVGNQTRTAHLRFHTDQPADFRKIFEYVVRRDMNLSPGTMIGEKEVVDYIRFFIGNVAEEAARYADLDVIHGSPTAGNRTTKGSTIDLMEFWYLDATHSDFKYLFDRIRAGGQKDAMIRYGFSLVEMLRRAKYPLPFYVNESLVRNRFEQVYRREYERLTLNRLGLEDAEIRKLAPGTVMALKELVAELRSTVGTETRKIFWNEIQPAAFDVRSILSKTFANITDPNREEIIFANHRPWATAPTPAQIALRKAYLKRVDEVLARLSPDGTVKSTWIEKAIRLGSETRMNPGTGMPATPGDPFFDAHDSKIIALLESGNFDFQEVNALIDRAVYSLTDRGIAKRDITNLGRSISMPWFDARRRGEVCRKIMRPLPAL